MAFGAYLSLNALYAYDNTLFDGLNVPEGMDKEQLINRLLMDTMPFSLVYPNGDIMKQMIAMWSGTSQHRWSRIWETDNYSYSPFENYDMTEEYDYTRTPDLTHTRTPNTTTTHHVEASEEGNNDVYTTAFNTTGLNQTGQNKGKTNGSSDSTDIETGTETSKESGTETEHYTKTSKGDASVRSASQVIMEMREERMFDIYGWIVDDFIQRFCVCSYAN